MKTKEIKGYPGYLIYPDGRIWSKPGKSCKQGKFLKATTNPSGYQRYRICQNGVCKSITAHRLVMEAFVGPRPKGFVIDHLSGDKSDNSVENLEYVRPEENSRRAIENGLIPRGSKNSQSKLTKSQVILIKEALRNGQSLRSLGKKYGVSKTNILLIKRERTWAHVRA